MNELVNKLVSALSTSKVTPYDTLATVTRIDGDTAYVHIDGGADETPCQLTISAKKGDIVKIRVSGGRAWITGNFTAPPTDDSAVKALESDTNVKLDKLEIKTDDASKTATNYMSFNSQYGEGLTIGNLIGKVLGKNAYIDSTGFHVRSGLEEISTFEEDIVSLAKGSAVFSYDADENTVNIKTDVEDGRIFLQAPKGAIISDNSLDTDDPDKAIGVVLNEDYVVAADSDVRVVVCGIINEYCIVFIDGKFARTSKDMSAENAYTLGTLKPAKFRPVRICALSYYGVSKASGAVTPMAYINNAGEIKVLQTAIASNPSNVYISGTYILTKQELALNEAN